MGLAQRRGPLGGRLARTAPAHLVQPAGLIDGVPRTRAARGHRHDHHGAADGRDAGQGTRPGNHATDARLAAAALGDDDRQDGALGRARSDRRHRHRDSGRAHVPRPAARRPRAARGVDVPVHRLFARHRAHHLGAGQQRREREHSGAAHLVPAGVHALGLRVPAELDPEVPAGGQLPVPGPLHDHDLARRVPQGSGLGRAVASSRSLVHLRGRLRRAREPSLRKEGVVSFKRIGLILWKEFRQFRRDRLLLPLVFMMPILQLIMFGYVVSADITDVKTAIVDLDRTPMSRELSDWLSGSGYFEIVARPDDERALRPLIDSGDAQVAVVIPEGTSRRFAEGQRAEIGIVVDGTDSRVSSVAGGYAAQILSAFNKQRMGDAARLLESAPGIQSSVRVLYNPSLKAVNSMIPGLMAAILMISTMTVMSQAVVRERESGTLEQMFTTPITRGEYIIGKMVPYVIIASLQISVVALVGRFWFGVPFNGTVWVVLLTLALFVFSTLGGGLLVSLVSRTRQQAQQTVMFIMLPFFVLAGFIFPIEAMPAPIVPLTYFIPLRYAVQALRAGWLKGATVAELWMPLLALAGFSVVIFTIAILSFHKRLSD
ncbi:MAG: ABC transporter permease [Actinobacteria bacterium]|nr:MAG: ABC transporter permease [Actinomycetota bacterium]